MTLPGGGMRNAQLLTWLGGGEVEGTHGGKEEQRISVKKGGGEASGRTRSG